MERMSELDSVFGLPTSVFGLPTSSIKPIRQLNHQSAVLIHEITGVGITGINNKQI